MISCFLCGCEANGVFNELSNIVSEKLQCSAVGSCLLYGLEGNHKSELCQSICDSLGIHFVHISCPSLIEETEASTTERIKNELKHVSSLMPCMCFLDKIEALEWSSLQSTEKNRLFPLYCSSIVCHKHNLLHSFQIR